MSYKDAGKMRLEEQGVIRQVSNGNLDMWLLTLQLVTCCTNTSDSSSC